MSLWTHNSNYSYVAIATGRTAYVRAVKTFEWKNYRKSTTTAKDLTQIIIYDTHVHLLSLNVHFSRPAKP